MGVYDTIKSMGISYQPTEEDLFAEVLREVESDVRRDGLWARALSESDMDNDRARAAYIRLRVQALRAETSKFIANLGEEKAAALAKRNEELNIAEREVSEARQLTENLLLETKNESIELSIKTAEMVDLIKREAQQSVDRAMSESLDSRNALSGVKHELAKSIQTLEIEKSSLQLHRWVMWGLILLNAIGIYMLATGVIRIAWMR